MKKANKFNARKIEYKGMVFDSKKEVMEERGQPDNTLDVSRRCGKVVKTENTSIDKRKITCGACRKIIKRERE